MNENIIKVGFCVAYDWRFLRIALTLVYDSADQICLSIDKDRCSWTHKVFGWDAAGFEAMIRNVDKAGKIAIYEDNFHVPGLSPKENEVRQRTLMAAKMGKGGWHIQLDCDEYFVNFDGFVKYLRSLPRVRYKYNVSCPFLTLFKEVDNGYLYVYPERSKRIEFFQVATRDPLYEHGRRNGYFNIHSHYWIIHQSWARTDEEIVEKVKNWGHVDDFNSGDYIRQWREVDGDNYRLIKNFHPVQPGCWPGLRFIEAKTVEQLILQFSQNCYLRINPVMLFFKNSRFLSKVISSLKMEI